MIYSSSWSNWCYNRHAQTNHMYDGHLPYAFHLRMTVQVGEQFIHLITDEDLKLAIEHALPGHDLIEDARTSYNDIVETLYSSIGIKTGVEKMVAEIILACTDEKGRNRTERHNPAYWKLLQDTAGAPFVKYCDRIANVKFGLLANGHMLKKYAKENTELKEMIGHLVPEEMVAYLDKLLTTTL